MTTRLSVAFENKVFTRNAFLGLSLLYMVALAFFPKAVFFIKPLLVPVLLVHYLLLTPTAEKFMLRALIFCWIGDIFMMFSSDQLYFLAGMLAFLFAHVLFIFSFRRRVWMETQHGRPDLSMVIMVLVGSLAGFVLYLILPGAGPMQVPLLVYVVVIVSMFFNAIRRRGRTSYSSFMLLSLGAGSFMVSDTILGLDSFYFNSNLTYGWLLVMPTYLAALYLMVCGFAKHPEARPSVPLPNV